MSKASKEVKLKGIKNGEVTEVAELGAPLEDQDFLDALISGDRQWKLVAGFIRHVMAKKEVLYLIICFFFNTIYSI